MASSFTWWLTFSLFQHTELDTEDTTIECFISDSWSWVKMLPLLEIESNRRESISAVRLYNGNIKNINTQSNHILYNVSTNFKAFWWSIELFVCCFCCFTSFIICFVKGLVLLCFSCFFCRLIIIAYRFSYGTINFWYIGILGFRRNKPCCVCLII